MRKSFFYYHRLTLLITLFPVVAIGIYFLTVYQKPLYIIQPDLQKNALPVQLTLDSSELAYGRMNVLSHTAHEFIYRYFRHDKLYPSRAKFRFSMPDHSYFDMAGYGLVKLQIKASKGVRVQFYLSSALPGYTTEKNKSTYRYLLSTLNINDQLQEITIPFDKLATPDWWYISNDKVENDFGDPDFERIKYLYFTNCINLRNKAEDTVEIHELSFHVDYWPFYRNTGIFLICYVLVVSAVIVLRKRAHTKKAKQRINFRYEKIKSQNNQHRDEDVVFAYLHTHYKQQELTLADVQKATGVSERKISALIKLKKDQNFKQYLNTVRIAEAKKLLLETELQILDIGFSVGYGNTSHFNKVFRAQEDCSPNDYRKKQLVLAQE